ncbi:hypothetical protein Acsp03_17880 [Actinomadura sp. NBRC 104412]|uniref:DUF397 domain-containing protein n=1 Tax=Actinomadura sp. NBRC 104412 TaxID=3032203 RepID=UPI0024A30D57|nr:DUF397 domain-containing protein [Actinomadura sp. NBRC 104412]GLZ04322.1 hypothetical protein Acsp03_17880 [Actinomadura sp. NBRC 104412]
MIVQWRKSSHTGGANDEHCVELAPHEQGIWVRDSKNPDGGHLSFTSAEFGALVSWIKRHPERCS